MKQDSDNLAAAFTAFEHAGWEQVHTGYETHFGPLTSQSSEPLLDAAEVSAGMRVLDVCCGPGMISAAAVARGADAVGLDFSSAAIDIARTRVPGAEFYQGDAEHLPFDAESFDAVVCGFGIIHLPTPERALVEMHRVLKTGRRAAASVWLPATPDNGFGLLYGAIRAHADLDVPLPSGPDFFQFSEPGALEAALADSGLDATRSVTVEQFWEMREATDFVTAMLEASVRARGLIVAQTDDVRRRIGAEVATGMAAFRGADGKYRLPMPAIIACGQK